MTSNEQEILERMSPSDRERYFLTMAGREANKYIGNGQATAAAIDTMAHSLVSYGNPSTDSDTHQAAMGRYVRAKSNLSEQLTEEVSDLYRDIIG